MMKKLAGQTKVFIVILILIGALAVYMTSQTMKYKNEKKAQVSATITAMEEYDRGTDTSDRGYDIYVDYEYEGQNYEHVMYKSVGLSTDLRLGDKMDLEVYVRNPSAIAQDANGFAIYTWILFAAGVVFVVIRVKNDLKIAAKNENLI